MPVKSIHKKLLINSTCRLCLLGLLFIVYSLQPAVAHGHHKIKQKGVVHAMIVLSVNLPNNDETFIGVIFRVSQRRYKLPKDANPAYLKLLKESEKDHTSVLVERAREQSDVIVSVKKDTAGITR
jgi:hypothetical protein